MPTEKMDVSTQTEVDGSFVPHIVHISKGGDDMANAIEDRESDPDYDPEDEEDEFSDSEEDDSEEYTEEDYTETEEEAPPPSKKRKVRYQGPEKEYFDSLPQSKKQQLLKLEDDVANINHVHTPLRFRLLESPMDVHLKSHAISKLNAMQRMDPCSGEYHKMMNYIEALSKIPIGKYKNLPVSKASSVKDITDFLQMMREGLDKAVYGHDEAKQQIIRLLAQWISNPQSKGLVIGIEGAAGIGKTTLVKEGICKTLGLPFGFVPLGGVSDGSFLVGHSYTYEGSRWGRMVEILMNCGCMNPILFFDELDKVSTTRYGEEIINILIHLTDSTQSDSFHDKYFSDIALDMSRCLIVFSYNHGDIINPILKDRMVTIKASGYTTSNKIEIFNHYMLPELCQKYALQASDIVFDKDVIVHIIERTPDEQGVRNLRRSLDEILSKINLARLLKEDITLKGKKEKRVSVQFPFQVSRDVIDTLLTCSRKYANESLPLMYM